MPFSFLPRMIFPHLTDVTAEALRARGMKSRLILQVHDELIVECPASEREQVERLLTEEMEQAASLSVPLIAEAHSGKNWLAAKE